MKSTTRRALASVELLTASSLWGFGFIATIWAFSVFTPFQVTFLRFAVAGALAVFLLAWADGRQSLRENVRVAFIPAFLLMLTLAFQTWGLQHTTATKSGFITTLYVVFVPILESLLSGTRLPYRLWFCVLTALIGTGLIVNLGIDDLNFGDMLTFVAALFATLQIFWLAKISKDIRRPFAFNLVQSLWGALLLSPVLFIQPLGPAFASWPVWPWQAWAGMGSLVFGSTVIAFFLQVRAQAYLSATVSSLIFLLESPFALIFAMFLLNEQLGLVESLGAFLIFLSAAAASLIEARRKKF